LVLVSFPKCYYLMSKVHLRVRCKLKMITYVTDQHITRLLQCSLLVTEVDRFAGLRNFSLDVGEVVGKAVANIFKV